MEQECRVGSRDKKALSDSPRNLPVRRAQENSKAKKAHYHIESSKNHFIFQRSMYGKRLQVKQPESGRLWFYPGRDW